MVSNNHFLLDTHVFIWLMQADKRINPNLRTLIQDPTNNIFISVATVWEIVIKKGLRKIKVPKDIEGGIKYAGLSIMPIELSHVLYVEDLPVYHKDPFDRILIAQAKVENLTFITHDKQIWKYDVDALKLI